MEGVDRINELRDEMLVDNIMSRLGCTTKELIRTTATISKRWKNLWTHLPCLIFSDVNDLSQLADKLTDLHGYISFIDNTLNQCPTYLNLKIFKLNIAYSSLVNVEFKSRANSWIRYAIRRNVEEVDIVLFDVGVGQGFTFEDDLFFNTSCITRMKLAYSRFNPPNGAISWERLECLCLSWVTLDEDMIEKILSGSPCLESLKLRDCYGYRRSKSVKNLEFCNYLFFAALLKEDYINRITINAPYISSLTIGGSLFLKELALLDVSSLIKVNLDYSINWGMSEISQEEFFQRLLESLDHIKDVTVNDYCWKLYSRLKARGVMSKCDVKALN